MKLLSPRAAAATAPGQYPFSILGLGVLIGSRVSHQPIRPSSSERRNRTHRATHRAHPSHSPPSSPHALKTDTHIPTGDIVVPGLFVGLLKRIDEAIDPETSNGDTFFKSGLAGYALGLLLTFSGAFHGKCVRC